MNNHVPLRMCVACRQMKPKSQLIRFALRDGRVVIDSAMKMQTRGAYLCRDNKCTKLSQKKRCLERHLKADCTEVYTELESIISEVCADE